MILEQKHIINKIFLEVNTNSTAVAHDLKNRLGLFLKEDILPYLENYFKRIEQKLPAEIVQIPQLTIAIKATSQNDFKTLKTDTKEKLVQKIDALLKAPSQATEEVILIHSQEHQTRSLLFFIEHGYTPWWKTTEDQLAFTHDDILEISSSNAFGNQYAQLLQNPICKKRSIQQFTDQELQMVLKASFKHTQHIHILEDIIIKTFTSLSAVSRDFIWSELITYLQSKNLSAFIENIASVSIHTTSFQNEGVYAFAKAVLAIIQQALKISTADVANILQGNTKNNIALASQLMITCDAIGLAKEATTILKPWLKDTTPNIEKLKDQEKIIPSTTKESDTLSSKEEILTTTANETVSTPISNNEGTNPEIAEQAATSPDEKRSPNDSKKESTTLKDNEESITIDTYIKEITSQQEEEAVTNTGTYYVPNAGLIILHPYIQPFFSNCGIIDDTNNITDIDLAVHTLHYLATKKEQQLESQMLFEKFLCGVPLQKTIQRHIQLSDTIKQQAEELLESVIENWGILNNASTDLLRHEFLQREGKLSFTEDNPKVVIERRTQDILVDRIPWGIGICRLPWLDHMVFTNW